LLKVALNTINLTLSELDEDDNLQFNIYLSNVNFNYFCISFIKIDLKKSTIDNFNIYLPIIWHISFIRSVL
jgi:hypothetical protein